MTDAEDFRTRVLDGAVEVLLQGGFTSDRLHTAIARQAGLSRPTVYKYGGTLEEIRSAVISREIAGLLDEISQVLEPVQLETGYMIELVATTVAYARAMPLLEAALRDIPEQVIPLLTLHADVVMQQVRILAKPLLDQVVEAGGLTPNAADLTLDVLVRLAVSLILIRSDIQLHTREEVAGYLRAAFRVLTAAGLNESKADPAHSPRQRTPRKRR